MMVFPALVVTDLDGTLIDESSPLSLFSVKVLTSVRSAGVAVALATGRHSSIVPRKRLSGLEFDYEITSGGAEVRSGIDRELVVSNRIPGPLVAAVVNVTSSLIDGVRIGFDGVVADGRYFQRVYGEAIDSGVDEILLQVGANADLAKVASALERALPHGVAVSRSGTLGVLQILASGSSKLAAVEMICRRLGFGLSSVVAFGDSWNDAEMLSACGVGVCVVGSELHALDRYKGYCGRPVDEGVARFMLRIMDGRLLLRDGEPV